MIEKYLSKYIVAVSSNTPIHEVVKIMHEKHVRNVFVKEENEFIGSITVHEIIRILSLRNKEYFEIYAKEIKSPLIKANINDKIVSIAKKIVESNIGVVAIFSDNNLLGKIGERDLLNYILEFNTTERIYSIMTKNPITVNYEATILDSINSMVKANSRHVPLIKDNRLFGMFSSRDLLKILFGVKNYEELSLILNEKIKNFANLNPLTIEPYATIKDCVNTLLLKNIGALLVVEKLPIMPYPELVGIVTERDITRYISNLTSF